MYRVAVAEKYEAEILLRQFGQNGLAKSFCIVPIVHAKFSSTPAGDAWIAIGEINDQGKDTILLIPVGAFHRPEYCARGEPLRLKAPYREELLRVDVCLVERPGWRAAILAKVAGPSCHK